MQIPAVWIKGELIETHRSRSAFYAGRGTKVQRLGRSLDAQVNWVGMEVEGRAIALDDRFCGINTGKRGDIEIGAIYGKEIAKAPEFNQRPLALLVEPVVTA